MESFKNIIWSTVDFKDLNPHWKLDNRLFFFQEPLTIFAKILAKTDVREMAYSAERSWKFPLECEFSIMWIANKSTIRLMSV